ncbi:MAG: hypothetical protein P8I54_02250 [Flavobacteriaceae bacterium]|nr:hypothetical protein [Flavobacteriaceae bacterium]
MSFGNSFAQIFTKEIVNYSIEDYSADNQNWGIDVSDNGIVYIANNKGLLRYTGSSWELFELPNKTIIRSVLVVGDAVYTGSYEEFGFWKNDDFGNLSYTSLNHFFEKDNKIDNEEFWQIVKHGDNIIFRSFANVYNYDGKKISSIPDSQGVLSISVFLGRLILCSLNRGIEELENGLLKPFKFKNNREKFKNIISSASYKNKLFFFDKNNGGFIYESGRITSLKPKISQILKEQILNKAIFLDSNLIAFGTIKNGVLIYNLKNQSIQHAYNRELGLKNNTILGLKHRGGKLWCALDNGACRIGIDSPYLNYKDQEGKLGTVYDIAFYKGKYYLASNTGLYLFKENKLSFVKGSEGHIWSLDILNKQLFCGHNSGIFYLNTNDKLRQLNKTSNGVFGYFSNPKRKNSFLLGV